jgi:hypothetical protein
MSAHYTVVQYVPDVVKDERINVGVIAFDQANVRVRFLDNWRRVRQFGNEDIGFLREFAERLALASDEQLMLSLVGERPMSAAELTQMTEEWLNSIQFSPLKASLRDVDALLDEATRLYLQTKRRVRRAFRTKQDAAKIAADHTERAILRAFGAYAASRLVARRYPFTGQYQEHKLDVAVKNGRVYYAAVGLSFELRDSAELSRQRDQTAWEVNDIRNAHGDLPLAVVTLPPRDDMANAVNIRRIYREAEHAFRGLGAEVLTEDNVDVWAAEMAERVPEDARDFASLVT